MSEKRQRFFEEEESCYCFVLNLYNVIYLGMIWWGEYDRGYFAITLTVKISFLLLHHVNNASRRICPQPVVCFRNFLVNKYHQIHAHKMSAHRLG